MIVIPADIKQLNLEDHVIALKSYDYEELSYDLIQLEVEYYELRPHMTRRETKIYQQLIKMYEAEKTLRVKKSRNPNILSSSVGNAMMSWLDE